MSFTLATLKTAIQDYADNSETSFVTNLPNFIKAAEEKIFKGVEIRPLIGKSSTSLKFLNK